MNSNQRNSFFDKEELEDNEHKSKLNHLKSIISDNLNRDMKLNDSLLEESYITEEHPDDSSSDSSSTDSWMTYETIELDNIEIDFNETEKYEAHEQIQKIIELYTSNKNKEMHKSLVEFVINQRRRLSAVVNPNQAQIVEFVEPKLKKKLTEKEEKSKTDIDIDFDQMINSQASRRRGQSTRIPQVSKPVRKQTK